MKTKTALLAVYYKDGIVEFAQALAARGWNILASRGTAKALVEGGVPVRDVGEIVGEPILGHRVVTLSREVHAGLLARNLPEDEAELARLGLPRIDLVCVDLYPLHAAIAAQGSTRESVIETTDVGGPTLLHSGAKGERIVISDPADRMRVIEWFDASCRLDEQAFIDYLNAKADAVVSEYCLTASRYRSAGRFDGFVGERVQECKYGENAWQAPAGLYQMNGDDPLALPNFRLVHGDAPSYNNLCDVDRMLQTVTHIVAAFDVNFHGSVPWVAVGVKHGNPCGASMGMMSLDVVSDMISGDTRAIFGGLVMLTFPVTGEIAEALLHVHAPQGIKRLLDGVVAPSFAPEAIELLARKGGKCRLIENPALENLTAKSLDSEVRFRRVRGGFLTQPNYTYVLDLKDPRLERYGSLTTVDEDNLLLAWAIGSTSNSNTITIVKSRRLIGNGCGQQDRVGGGELAVKRARDAGHDVRGAVAYSDSFFPFPDGPQVLAEAGVKAILTSSGSVKDTEIRAVCKAKNVSLVMVPDTIGRGFYNH